MPVNKKTSSAAPTAAAKKKSTKKIKTKSTRAASSASSGEPKSYDYVYINQPNPELAFKYKVLWVVIGIVCVLLVLLWFWNLKENISSASRELKGPTLSSELSDILKQVKDEVGQKKNQPETVTNDQLADIKNEIVKKLQENLNSQTWPLLTSQILGLSLQYPTDWIKKESGQILALSSFPATATPPAAYGSLNINLKATNNKLPLDDWLAKNFQAPQGYVRETISTTTIAGQKTAVFVNELSDRMKLYYVDYNKKIYEISVASLGTNDYYSPITNAVIKSIKFIK